MFVFFSGIMTHVEPEVDFHHTEHMGTFRQLPITVQGCELLKAV